MEPEKQQEQTFSQKFQLPAGFKSLEDYFYYNNKTQTKYELTDLFKYYNETFFEGILSDTVLRWSNKLKVSSANTYLSVGGNCYITLSAPILGGADIDPNDLKATLLHEMIHAYLWKTNPHCQYISGGHGPEFLKWMNKLNKITRLGMSVYHEFDLESLKNHVWQCNGPCRKKGPDFGVIKKTQNRPPKPTDSWWDEHEKSCGGKFVKVKGPGIDEKGTKKCFQKKKKESNFDKKSKKILKKKVLQ